MEINPYIFRGYDVRGIVGTDLDASKVEALGRSYGTFLEKRKIRQAVIGRDCRLSGEEYAEALIRGLTATGIDTTDLGMAMTQMVYFAQYYFQTNGAVMITASHNPPNFNGFKFATGYSRTASEAEIQELRKRVEQENFFVPAAAGTATKLDERERKAFAQAYARDLLKRVKIDRKFKVVVDTGNGTTGAFNPGILEQAGCEVICQNLDIDGHFPAGTPDPTGTEMMERVRQRVLKEGADLGVAFDGDGDRVGVVDGKGNILWNDVLVAIFAKEILERFPGSKIVINTLCSQLTAEVIEQSGGIPVTWRVGHGFIRPKIAEVGAAFGGELSGHFFFADNFYGYDDGTYALLRVLDYLSAKNVSLNELYQEFPHYVSSPEIKIGCPDDKKAGIIERVAKRLKEEFPNAKVTDREVIPGDDGVRVDFEDGMMVVRYSQNGPYITVKFEAKDQRTYDERKNYVKALLKSYPEMMWEDKLAVNLHSLD